MERDRKAYTDLVLRAMLVDVLEDVDPRDQLGLALGRERQHLLQECLEVVLTGALGPMIPTLPGDTFAATIDGLGTVICSFD